MQRVWVLIPHNPQKIPGVVSWAYNPSSRKWDGRTPGSLPVLWSVNSSSVKTLVFVCDRYGTQLELGPYSPEENELHFPRKVFIVPNLLRFAEELFICIHSVGKQTNITALSWSYHYFGERVILRQQKGNLWFIYFPCLPCMLDPDHECSEQFTFHHSTSSTSWLCLIIPISKLLESSMVWRWYTPTHVSQRKVVGLKDVGNLRECFSEQIYVMKRQALCK